MNRNHFYLLLIGLAFFLLSCSEKNVFEQYQKLDKQSWNRFNILKFEVPVTDSVNEFDVFLAIRHLPEFQVKEFTVNMTLYAPSGEVRTANHVIEFTDKEGNSLSECLGDFCDILIPLREDFVFPEKGTIRFEIENKYPKIELPGILEVGFVVKRTKF
ncbi:MAG: hypothetical protein FJY07_14650 [Bacteroidetes bacterium]|nr:hypothetical protein [Bacteroidota bacterium]